MKALLDRLRAAFRNLADREQMLVAGAGTMLLVVLGYFLIVSPILRVGDRTEERVGAAQQQLEVVTRMRHEFDGVQQRLAAVEQRIQTGPKGNLRTTLETLAREASVRVESMEPQASPANDRYRETKIEVGLKEVTLPETVQYLHAIESTRQVLSVKSLRIRTRSDKPELLDVTFTVSSFERL
jgi:type II secretory pathway component PulM